jgi:hypothetical protein
VTFIHAFKGRSSNEGEWIKALRSIFGLVKEEAAEGLESSRNLELHNLFHIKAFRLIKSRGPNGWRM